ncbi:hypothetical protein ABZ128_07175 [Streptomyces sp. NPDC006326]|uniref:hypothetical protein n=1 Tax=Streptomyces sp. NPDC006326 TaxID=3156752 RepID=UPI0033BA1D15
MESDRRAVLPLVEVMVLAEALYTHPLRLIYPVGYVEEVQQLPLTYPVDTAKAMRWFAGLNENYQADHRMLHRPRHSTGEGPLRRPGRRAAAVGGRESDR